MKRYLILALISLLFTSANAQSINPVHFGYIKWDKDKPIVRLEMNLAPSITEKDPGDLYELFIKIFLEKDLSKPVSGIYNWPNEKDRRNPRTKLKETQLTESQFKSLATEKIGDVYTLVSPGGIWQAKVTGGTIAIDEQFDDLFRVYLDLEIDHFKPPIETAGKSRVETVGFVGSHTVSNLKSYEQVSLGQDQQMGIEKLLRAKIKKGFNDYYFNYFRNGPDLMVVADNVAVDGSEKKYEGDYEEVAKFQSAVYLLRDGQLLDIFPAKVARNNEVDTPSSYKALYRFEVDGEKYECIEEDGQYCCTGGPFSQYHVFKFNPKTTSFKEIGESRDYPLCMELFL